MQTKIQICLLTTLILLIINACKKQDIPAKPEPTTTFTAVLQNNPPYSSARTATSINIIAGTNGWYLTQTPANNWCIPAKQFGAGDFNLGLTINANTTGADRSTEIILTSTNKNLAPVKLTIAQSK